MLNTCCLFSTFKCSKVWNCWTEEEDKLVCPLFGTGSPKLKQTKREEKKKQGGRKRRQTERTQQGRFNTQTSRLKVTKALFCSALCPTQLYFTICICMIYCITVCCTVLQSYFTAQSNSIFNCVASKRWPVVALKVEQRPSKVGARPEMHQP